MISGNRNPVAGTTYYYEINALNLLGKLNSSYEWHVFKKNKNKTWRDITETPKTGKRVSYKFGEIAVGIEFEIKVYEIQPELLPGTSGIKKLVGSIILIPVYGKVSKIDRVVLFNRNGKNVNKAGYRDTLTAQAHCIAMFGKEIEFHLWEDDAPGGGHDPVVNKNNRHNKVYRAVVNENGIAEVKILLMSDERILRQMANKYLMIGDQDEGAYHEYYVTATYSGKIVGASQVNVDVVNPDYKKGKPAPHTPKFPSGQGGKMQTDPKGNILDAVFINDSGKELSKVAVGEKVRIRIHSKNMVGKYIQYVVWEYDAGAHDEIYRSGHIKIPADVCDTTSGFVITKGLFEKGIDLPVGDPDADRQHYFIEIISIDLAAESQRFGVDSNGLMEVENVRSPAMVKEEKVEQSKDENCPNCNKNITLNQMKKIFPDCKDETKLQEAMKSYNNYMEKFHMNTCWNKAHFFAQTFVESGTALNYKNESFNYTTRRLIKGDYTSGFVKGNLEKKIPGYNTTGKFNKRPFAYFDNHHNAAEKLGRKDVFQNNDGLIQKANPETIANQAYGPNSVKGKELKNTQEGDGWLYRGRGFIQITGRVNYEACNKYTKQYASVEILSMDGANKVGTSAEVAMLACMGYWIADDRKIQNKANGEKNEDKISKFIGTNVDWAGKKKAFDEITSELFKVNECIYGRKENDAKKGSKNQYDIDVDNFSFKMITRKSGSDDYEYNVYVAGKKIKTYSLKKNSHGLIPFPESGSNWGRFGSRDKGGDNWINEKACAALLGFFYSLPYNGYAKILYFNDISANDGRNIGHAGHNIAGNDIDIRYPGSTNGGQTLWKDAVKTYKDEATFIKDLENIISVGVRWKFIKNYAYKKEIKNTTGKATSVHQDHFHLGYR